MQEQHISLIHTSHIVGAENINMYYMEKTTDVWLFPPEFKALPLSWTKITSPTFIETNDLLKKALLEKCYQDTALNLCCE